MELRQLRYFQAVADTLSFSRAAERLRVAQPAVSRQIAALEHELGASLLTRTTSRVRLTDAGRHFHREVGRILAQLANTATATQAIARGQGGELRLGSDWRMHVPRMSDAVIRFRADNPGVALNFVELPIHQQVDALRDGRIHLAFVSEAIVEDHPELETRLVSRAAMKAVVAAHHPLATAKAVSIRELRDETWVKLEEKTHPGYRTLLVQLCRPARFTPRFRPVAGSVAGLLALVATGDGIALLPESIVARADPGLRFLDVDCPPFDFYAAWLPDAPLAARTRFLDTLDALIGSTPRRRPSK